MVIVVPAPGKLAEIVTTPEFVPITVVPAATLKVSAPSSTAAGAADASVVPAASVEAMAAISARVVLERRMMLPPLP
jgi:hypothetical protein